MLTTIKGYYDQGEIILQENPQITIKTEVIVTFLTDKPTSGATGKRQLGGLEGMVNLPDDFNEPLNYAIL